MLSQLVGFAFPRANLRKAIQLSEEGRGALRRNTRDFLKELDESIQVVGNDAYRSEIHEISPFR